MVYFAKGVIMNRYTIRTYFQRGVILGILFLVGRVGPLLAGPPIVEKYLQQGDYLGGEKALLLHLDQSPKDAEVRFGLGALQFIQAVEGLGQDLYRFGMNSDIGTAIGLPFFRLPIPNNPKPQEIDYEKFRTLFTRFMDGLTKAEKNLAMVRDSKIKLPLKMGLIKLDLEGDGKADEYLKTILSRYLRGGVGNNPLGEMAVSFDQGDAIWLQGYCNLLLAMGSVILAHDHKETFEVSASLFFPKVKTPFGFLNHIPRPKGELFSTNTILDLIAFIHMWRFPLKDPKKMDEALGHLEKVLALSRESWTSILEETDNDMEWLPNPKQTGVMGIAVQRQMIDGWFEFIDEAESLLKGKKLIPFWREGENRGVNLRRLFTQARDFDAILWIQGTAANPYLENGILTNQAVWGRLQRIFGGEFFGFAFWFN